jgi:hypothetical protein
MKQFLAIYTGSPGMTPASMSEEAIQQGMAAWGKWMMDHADSVVVEGGPLGKTKSVGKGGVSDIRNSLTGYTVIRAESHEEAAKLFEGHPHFTIFPGEAVEVMEIMPIPGR